MEVTGRKLEAEQETGLFCEPCEVDNSKTPANGACRECKEYMCKMCFRHHLKSKHSRNHVLLSLEEFSTQALGSAKEDVIACKKHDNEVIKFYCKSHDLVGCGDCMVFEHTSCKPEYIKDLAKKFKDGNVYKTIVKGVEDLEKKKTDYEQDIEKSESDFEEMDVKAIREIREFRKEINKCLDEAEAEILSEIKKLKKENKETQTKIQEGLQALTLELEMMKQKLDIELHHENTLFINAMNCKSELVNAEKMYVNIKQENELKCFEYSRDKNMSELLNAVKPLGRLFINAMNCKSELVNAEKMYVNIKQENELKCFEYSRDKNMSELLNAVKQLGRLDISIRGHSANEEEIVVGVGQAQICCGWCENYVDNVDNWKCPYCEEHTQACRECGESEEFQLCMNCGYYKQIVCGNCGSFKEYAQNCYYCGAGSDWTVW